MEREKTYFVPGDVVKIKHNIYNVPRMLVQSVDKATIGPSGGGMLLGVTCIWFNVKEELQKHRFSTKDLIKV